MGACLTLARECLRSWAPQVFREECLRSWVPQVFREECLIYMVLEYGDIDLARLLQNHEEARRRQLGAGGASSGGGGGASSASTVATGGSGEIDENFIRLYWQQMLQVRWQGALA